MGEEEQQTEDSGDLSDEDVELQLTVKVVRILI